MAFEHLASEAILSFKCGFSDKKYILSHKFVRELSAKNDTFILSWCLFHVLKCKFLSKNLVPDPRGPDPKVMSQLSVFMHGF